MSISAHSVATGGTGATAATAVTAATGKTVATFATFGEEEPETEARAQETDLSLIAAIPNTNPDIAAMQKKSWSSLQRTLIMCHEMDIYGKHTLEKLGEAKEKFHRLADYQGKVERDLLETATHLDDMQKCCGVFPMPWTGRRKHGPVDEDAYDDLEEVPSSQPPKPSPTAPISNQPSAKDTSKLTMVLISQDYVELQMDHDMDLLDTQLDNLESISTDINSRLKTEHREIDSAADIMDRNIIRVNLARKKALVTLRAV